MHSGITAEAIEAAGRAQEAAGVPPMTSEQTLLVGLLLGPRGDTDRRVRGALFTASCAPWAPVLPEKVCPDVEVRLRELAGLPLP